MTNQKELDLSKPCVTQPGGVPVVLSCGCSTKGTCCWNAKTTKDSTHLNIFWTDNFGTPIIPGFPAVRNVPEPEPVDPLDCIGDMEVGEVVRACGRDWNTDADKSIEIIKTAYRVVAAKLEALAKEQTNGD